MQVKLKRGGHRNRYRLRKQTVEPVFGQIKQTRGFRQVLLTAAAYVLLQKLRPRAQGTICATAQVATLRERLLKLAVWVG